jgi:hypothetical protein
VRVLIAVVVDGCYGEATQTCDDGTLCAIEAVCDGHGGCARRHRLLDAGTTDDCDGADLGAATCVSVGFYGGTLGCDGLCRLVSCGGPATARSTAPSSKTCTQFGFNPGVLGCDLQCHFVFRLQRLVRRRHDRRPDEQCGGAPTARTTRACGFCGDGTCGVGEDCTHCKNDWPATTA